ncbi:hypothetical protein Scep_007127 [Stephania cephalantha]|uniref:Uncharacterized protein n=1 Tax=Stephania cephalantha TaxID=152367 RepID=A0AAP0KAI1_9MAGN
MAWARRLDKSRKHGLEQLKWHGPEIDATNANTKYNKDIRDRNEEIPRVIHEHTQENSKWLNNEYKFG